MFSAKPPRRPERSIADDSTTDKRIVLNPAWLIHIGAFFVLAAFAALLISWAWVNVHKALHDTPPVFQLKTRSSL